MPNDIVIIPGSKTITFQDGSNTVQRLSITGSGLKFTGAITSSKLSVSNNLIIDGNVGIGTSSPSAKLHVSASASTTAGIFQGSVGIGTTSPTYLLEIYKTSNDAIARVKTTTAGAYLYLDSATDGYFGTRLVAAGTEKWFLGGYGTSDLQVKRGTAYDGAEVFRITTTGNVGIGTSTANSRLHVSGSIRAAGGSDSTFVSIVSSGTDRYFLDCYGTSNRQIFALYENSSNVYLNSWSSMNFRANQTGGSGGAIAFTGGNVGIGTSSPATRLDVVSTNASFPATSGTTQNTGSIVRLRNGNSNLVLDIGGNGGNGNWLQSTNRTDLSLNYPLLLNPNGGNVGIGTTSPSAKLHVSASASTTAGIFQGMVGIGLTPTSAVPRLQIYGTSTTNAESNLAIYTSNTGTAYNNGFQMGVDASSIAYLLNCSNTALYFATNGTEKMRIAAAGNVGIGSTSPGAKLDVNAGTLSSTANSTLTIATFNSSLGNASYLKILEKRNSVGGGDWTTATTRIQKTIDVTDQAYIDFNPTGSAYGIAFGTGATTPTQKMVININGNVGIGTSSPVHLLSVYGTAVSDGTLNVVQKISSNASYSTTPTSGIGFGANFNSGGTNAVLSGIAGGKENASDNNFAGVLLFYTRPNGGDHTERMRITSDGNVGIGTTTVTAKLHVSGSKTSTLLRLQSPNATNALFVSGSGNIGIGTSSPVTKLDVRGYITSDVNSNGAESGFYLGNSAHGLRRIVGGNDVYLYTTSGTLYLGTTGNSSTQITLLNGGNLGIGTSSPTRTLHVSGSARLNGAFYDGNNSAGTSGSVLHTTGTKTVWKTLPSGGSNSIWVGAGEMIPRTFSGSGVNSLELTGSARPNYDVLEFDAAILEYAQVMRVLPNNWTAGTVTGKFYWTTTGGTVGNSVVWGLRARCYSDDNPINSAGTLGTEQTVTDSLLKPYDMHISAATSAITISGSLASGKPIIFEVYRDATNISDTLAVDAQLLGMEITY